jgi:hypothetical protein
MPKPSSDIKIVRVTDLYDTCKCVTLYRDGEEIGDSHLSLGEPSGPLWYISALGLETTLRFDPATTTKEENLAAVELTLRLQVSAADALGIARAA